MTIEPQAPEHHPPLRRSRVRGIRLFVPGHLVPVYERAAARRNLRAELLLDLLLHVIAKDDLIDAVIDDQPD